MINGGEGDDDEPINSVMDMMMIKRMRRLVMQKVVREIRKGSKCISHLSFHKKNQFSLSLSLSLSLRACVRVLPPFSLFIDILDKRFSPYLL